MCVRVFDPILHSSHLLEIVAVVAIIILLLLLLLFKRDVRIYTVLNAL